MPLQDQVYEGSYRIWTPALAHPGYHEIVWVVMHDSAQDQVYAGLHSSIVRFGYRLAWTSKDYLIYRWGGTAAQLTANAAARRLGGGDGAGELNADAQLRGHPSTGHRRRGAVAAQQVFIAVAVLAIACQAISGAGGTA